LDGFLFIIILVFVGLPIGIGCLFYFIPKKLGYPKIAKYLTIVYGLIVLTIVFFTAFEDQFFTKNNAKELVEEQEIELSDDFQLLKNQSMSAIGEYYHTFTLKISAKDKANAILKIKNSEYFKTSNGSIDSLMFQTKPDRYFGNKIIQNYETEDYFVREYFKPSGRSGYAPTFRRIIISKTKNELTFEDIDE
jgi:hypothetical protein